MRSSLPGKPGIRRLRWASPPVIVVVSEIEPNV